MKTKKREELIHSFLEKLDEELAAVYREIILYLSELGYNPYKAKNAVSFKCDLHNKQIAKMGLRSNKEYSPFFALRFSACRDYPQRFRTLKRLILQNQPIILQCARRASAIFARENPNLTLTHAFCPQVNANSTAALTQLKYPILLRTTWPEFKI